MNQEDFQEKFWGGIFGVISITAAIGEVVINGISLPSILGAVKDVFGTLVVVVLLVAFIKQLPRKLKNISEILEQSVESWGIDNAPLIFKAQGYVSAKGSDFTQGFLLLQNPRNYASLSYLNPSSPDWLDYAKYGSGKKFTGKFIDLPDYKTMTETTTKIQFIMEQSHFSNMPEMNKIISDIVNSINVRYKDIATASRIGSSYKFTVSYKKISSAEDIKIFIEILDYILSLVKVVA
ncbi:hypothetical protein DSECCO2_565810 [anaerobic digester metagenome]